MKIIRPEITAKPEIKKVDVVIEHKQEDLIDDSTPIEKSKSIENIMDSVLRTEQNVITFNITLTKKTI